MRESGRTSARRSSSVHTLYVEKPTTTDRTAPTNAFDRANEGVSERVSISERVERVTNTYNERHGEKGPEDNGEENVESAAYVEAASKHLDGHRDCHGPIRECANEPDKGAWRTNGSRSERARVRASQSGVASASVESIPTEKLGNERASAERRAQVSE